MGSRSKGDPRGRPQPICRPRQSPSSPIAIAGPACAEPGSIDEVVKAALLKYSSCENLENPRQWTGRRVVVVVYTAVQSFRKNTTGCGWCYLMFYLRYPVHDWHIT